jgi:pseudouridine-5'-phosphate glycosidase
VADVARARADQGVSRGALILANPLPVEEQLDPQLHDRTLAEGLELLARERVTGKAVTPFLLAHFHESTAGQSLAVNVRIILRNAALAAQIAAAGSRTSAAPLGFSVSA